ncbi:hypothetical protein RHMOL_Rhmol13G0107900 [Rhododendron molle]|uniref:Uncharacterized protein n=1 Tax=Rhododendron molle TaxID=49168 RepID=A0ACC0L6P5_RHOML|nr:hypothetical protein RHMOL_Rhmol13G0107900 [Rhododendron molle]
MDEELLELQRQFEFAQQAQSSIRLSDRNVVELVQKLHDLRIIDFDLLHTVSGKEYITPEQLSLEIVAEIEKLGRVSVIDLADATGVDLYHVEKQTQRIVSNDASLTLINGEVISTSYWDTVAEEINDRLQECSQIALAEIAAQLQVKGRLEGGQLYTPAYVSRVNAMVCGASRGITVPTNLSAVWSSLQMLLQEMDGASGVAVESSFFQTLFNGLVKDGEILGSLRAGVHWTPAVFAIAQKESVDSFFSQNSFVSYEFLHKLGIPQPIQYLQSRYPEGIPLESIFVHPSTIEMLDAAAEDAIERNSWIDSLSVLPASFASQDASRILSLCRSVQVAVKSNKALILGESYVFGMGFVKDLFDCMEKETEICNLSWFSGTVRDDLHAAEEAKTGKETSSTLAESSEIVNVSSTNKQGFEKGSKKRKGKSAGKTGPAETGPDTQEPTVPSKSKKNQRKGKDTASFQVSDAKSGAKKESDRTKEDNLFVSEEWLIEKIMSLFPEFDEQGMDDPETILRPLANHVRPMLLNSWKERRKVAFTDNAQRMKRVLDNLQRKIDESFLNMQLYVKALDLFEDDQSTSVILHRHLLRTTATSIVDTVLLNLAKSLPGLLSVKAVALVESLEGKSVESFVTAFRAMAEERNESSQYLGHSLDLISQVSAEVDPVPLLPKVVSLLYIQVHNKALQAPGRAISVAVSRLKEKLDDSAYKILMDYHTATVALLALMSAATGDDEDCTSDRVLTKKELLDGLMPELKGLVLSSSQS